METMFGKSYNTVGTSSANFIIKTKGDLKVLWGNKFIDLIKNGKVASSESNLLEIVESIDSINSNGIYLIPNEEDYEVWVSIDGTKINLTNSSSFVSFLKEQPEITSDLKYIALRNIGFYYDSLDSLKLANISKGIVYNLLDNILYVVNNGLITPYLGPLNINNKFTELFVDTLKIAKDKAIMCISNNSSIEFKIDSNPVLTIQKEGIHLHKELKGESFRLYFKNGESYLEVDNINWKSMNKFSKNSNSIWFMPENYIYPLRGGFAFKYPNNYKVGDSFYILLQNPVTISFVNGHYVINHTIPIDLVLKTYSGLIITIPRNTLVSVESGSEEYYEIIQGKLYIFDISTVYVITISTKDSEIVTFTPSDLEITSAPVRFFDNPLTVIGEDIKQIENDRIITKVGNIQNIEQLKRYTDPGILTTGIFSENIISLNLQLYDGVFKKLNKFPEYDKNIEIPKDKENKKYNKVVPSIEWIKLLLVPVGSIIMFNGTQPLPKGWAVCDGTNGTPNLIGKFIKAGTSIGDITSNLNENNELILTDKHMPRQTVNIKGNTATTQISLVTREPYAYSVGNTSTSVLSEVKGLPQGAATTSTDVIKSVGASYSEITVNGSHNHSINITTNIGELNPLPIKIEPRAYSLIFIMKITNDL